MKYFRLFSDSDGESQMEEIKADCFPTKYAPQIDATQPAEATRYVFVRFPAGWESDFHPAPRRQLLVVLTGVLEGETSKGHKQVHTAGSALLLEDTSGKGHAARVKGDVDVTALMVHLE